MFRTLIDIYTYDFENGSTSLPGKIIQISNELLRLIKECTETNNFSKFFLKKEQLALTSASNYTELEKYGLIKKVDNNLYESKVMCHKNPVRLSSDKDWYIITDWPDVEPYDSFDEIKYDDDTFNIGRNMVFPIHYESIYLCEHLRGQLSPDKKNVLDLFCGSGIFGVYALLNNALRVCFVDNNVRALTFTLLNLAINCGNFRKNYIINVLNSNIFDALSADDPNNKYDLILANPPFEPVPEGMSMKCYFSHSYGGEDGQYFMKLFINSCHNYLSKKGFVFGVDFSPGMTSNENLTLQEILADFQDQTGWQTKSDSLGHCSLFEFASRYLALGIDIEDYHKWLANLTKRKVSQLYFCWFTIGRELSNIQIKEENIKANWSNPYGWNYPCGITSKTKMHWVYLEDSFFIRENIFSQQLKNECLLSKNGEPGYLDIREIKTDANFPGLLTSFEKSLHDFQYGTLGKPEKVTWMCFPRASVEDDEAAGIIFDDNGEDTSKSRQALRQIIAERLGNENPKIIIFYDIYNKNPNQCESYFGDFASCTMSLFMADGKNIIYEIDLDKEVDVNLLEFIHADLSKKSYSIYKRGESVESLQTYCFMLEWEDSTAEIFHNLLKLDDKIFFDGLHKRLLFIISHGLNSLATVGLIGQQFLAEALQVEKANLQVRIKEIDEERKELAELISTVKKYSTDIIDTASVATIKDSELRKKAKWARKIKLFDETLANIPCETSLLKIEEFCREHDYRLTFPEYRPQKKSLRHMFIENTDQLMRNEIARMINEAIAKELEGFSVSNTYMSHLSALTNLMQVFNIAGHEWWPLLGDRDVYDCWKPYITDKLTVQDENTKYIPNVNMSFLGEGAILMPFLCYPIDELFACRDDAGDRRYPPNELGIEVSADRKMTSINLKWEGNLKWEKTISDLLKSRNLQTQKLSGRLWFLSQIFPIIDGNGFSTENKNIIFSFNIHYTWSE